MYCTRKLTEQVWWVGGSDRRLALFENLFPITRGVSYNSYLILDEQTAVVDTVDSSISRPVPGERAPHPGRPPAELPGDQPHGARPLRQH